MSSGELLLFAAPAAAVGGLATVLGGRDGRACLSMRREGIRTNKQVKQLLLDLQQHRGMSNAFLNGDAAFKPRIEKKQAEISGDIGSLDASEGSLLMTRRRWDAIKQSWQELRGTAFGLTQEESFRRNSVLIRDVLYSMGDVAERSQIIGCNAADPTLVNALWSDLPAVAEGLGQARGLGAGVAAKGQCSSVARIKLRFLEERIRETAERVSGELADSGIARVLDPAVTRAWAETGGTIREFLALLEGKLINVPRPAIDADQYFGAATKALDVVFRVFDLASDALDAALGGPRVQAA